MEKEFNSGGYKHVSDLTKMPTEPHFAVIKFGSTYIEGDERSRTNPGHGYPAHSIPNVEYIVFKDRSSWEIYIDGLLHPKYGHPDKNWTAVQISPAKVYTKTQMSISVDNPEEELNR
jgi:hypothetical protein